MPIILFAVWFVLFPHYDCTRFPNTRKETIRGARECSSGSIKAKLENAVNFATF